MEVFFWYGICARAEDLGVLKGFCFAQVTLCLGSDRVRFSQKVLFWLEINKRWFQVGPDCANLFQKFYTNRFKKLLAIEKFLKELEVSNP